MSESVKSIEELRKEYDKLNTIKIQVGTQLKTAEKQLDELKQKAKAEFGTDDVAELKEKLAKIKEENLSKRQEYQGSLDTINQKLTDIEKQFN